MGEPTRGARAEPSSRDQKLRRERGKGKGNIYFFKRRKGEMFLPGNRGAVAERDGAQHDGMRVATTIELAGGSLSSLLTCAERAIDDKHGVGRAAEVLGVYQEMGCDIVGLQVSALCGGEYGGERGGKKSQPPPPEWQHY